MKEEKRGGREKRGVDFERGQAVTRVVMSYHS